MKVGDDLHYGRKKCAYTHIYSVQLKELNTGNTIESDQGSTQLR